MGVGAVAALVLALVFVVLGMGAQGCAATSASGSAALGPYCSIDWEADGAHAELAGEGSCRLPDAVAGLVPHGSEDLVRLRCTATSPWAAAVLRHVPAVTVTGDKK